MIRNSCGRENGSELSVMIINGLQKQLMLTVLTLVLMMMLEERRIELK